VDDKLLPVEHWELLKNSVKDCSNVLLEYSNEYHEPKDVEPAKSSTNLCARGSTLSGEKTARTPVWDYSTSHWNDASEWQRKTGHNSWEMAEGSNAPVSANENTRFPDKDSSAAHAYDSAAGAKLFNAGICFHSVSGKNSTLFSDQEIRLATLAVGGANSVDIRYRHGFYQNLPPGDLLRLYSKSFGDDRQLVKIRF